MTKEERAEKWFRNIPNTESISMEKKMEICSRVARKMAILFFVVFIVECILLFIVNEGKIFNYMADFFNSFLEGRHTKIQYKGLALVGAFVCSPLIIFPSIVTIIFRNKQIKSEACKVIGK